MNEIDSITSNTVSITSFLRQLAQKIDEGHLSQRQLFSVGEFIMTFTRQIALQPIQQVNVGENVGGNAGEHDESKGASTGMGESMEGGMGRVNDNAEEPNEDEESGEDLKKFLIMGWYVYQLLKDVEFVE